MAVKDTHPLRALVACETPPRVAQAMAHQWGRHVETAITETPTEESAHE